MRDSNDSIHVPSRRIGAAGLAVPILMLPLSIVLAIVYAYVVVYTPIAGYISLLFVFGLAFAIGWTISWFGHRQRCRSPRFLRMVGLGCGVTAFYVSWVAFEYALLNRGGGGFDSSLLDLAAAPESVWELARILNSEGWYSVMGMTPKGVLLWIFWGIEALVILGIPPILSSVDLEGELFCETCGKWTEANPALLHVAAPDDESDFDGLGLQGLEACPAPDPMATRRVQLDAWHCDSCDGTNVFQLTLRDSEDVDLDPGEFLDPDQEDILCSSPLWSVNSMRASELRKLAERRADEQGVKPEALPVKPDPSD